MSKASTVSRYVCTYVLHSKLTSKLLLEKLVHSLKETHVIPELLGSLKRGREDTKLNYHWQLCPLLQHITAKRTQLMLHLQEASE